MLRDLADTAALAKRLALAVRTGDVIALSGDLGAGKTTFARAFIASRAAAEGTPERAGEVPSPTFTLVQAYALPQTLIRHFDLYRIRAADEIAELGFEDELAESVTLVEWPDRLGPSLPDDRLDLSFTIQSGEERLAHAAGTGASGDRLARVAAEGGAP